MSTPTPASTFKLEASEDPLRVLRDEFVIPTNAQMKAGAVAPELGERRSFLDQAPERANRRPSYPPASAELASGQAMHVLVRQLAGRAAQAVEAVCRGGAAGVGDAVSTVICGGNDTHTILCLCV